MATQNVSEPRCLDKNDKFSGIALRRLFAFQSLLLRDGFLGRSKCGLGYAQIKYCLLPFPCVSEKGNLIGFVKGTLWLPSCICEGKIFILPILHEMGVFEFVNAVIVYNILSKKPLSLRWNIYQRIGGIFYSPPLNRKNPP